MGNSGSSSNIKNGPDNEIHFPVLTNPLLAVAQSTWLETAISADAKSWVPHFSPRFGEAEGTMRGSDPALPPPIRARCDAIRDWSARLLAFAVPNRRAVAACRRALEACGGDATGIVEVGAGLGYWKWVLEERGGEVAAGGRDKVRLTKHDGILDGMNTSAVAAPGGQSFAARAGYPLKTLAIDKDPSRLPSSSGEGEGGPNGEKVRAARERGKRGGRGKGRGVQSCPPPLRSNEYHGGAPAWAPVEEGDPERLRILSAGAYPALLLCYPPPSIGKTVACMGADTLARFSGKILLYVGEVGGDTGSPRLEAALQAGWNLVEEIDLPCFSSTANRLMVFARKGGVFLPLSPAGESTASVQQQLHAVDRSKHESAARGLQAGQDASVAGENIGGGWGPALGMYRCARCKTVGGGEIQLYRCRLTRAVCYCSEKCLSLDGERRRANLEARHVHLRAFAGSRSGTGSSKDGCSLLRDKKMFKRLAAHSG